MIARMLLVLLLVLNLGVAAWWAWHRPAPAPMPAPLDDSVPTLVLLRPSEPAPVAQAAANPEQPAAPGQDAPAPDASTPSATAPTLVCVSFGPYADEAAVQAARQRIATPDMQASIRRAGSARVRGYNVSMPPLANREAALAMAERLRAAGFNDLLLRNDGAAANGIALGRFGSEENARRHQAALQAKGFSTQVEPIGDPGAPYWLDVRAPTGFDIQTQRARLGAAQAQARACPG